MVFPPVTCMNGRQGLSEKEVLCDFSVVKPNGVGSVLVLACPVRHTVYARPFTCTTQTCNAVTFRS